MKKLKQIVKSNYLLVIVILLFACETDYLPKPKGYNRFDLPNHEYVSLVDTFPYSFEFSKHAKLLKDSSWMSERYWIEIYYPEFKADIHLTYKVVGSADSLKEYFNDAYFLTAKHQIKAYAIDESITKTPNGKTVVYAELEGEVPSQFQFYTTDSTKHFLRGALYFNTKVQNDSLMPAIEFVKIDIVHMMNSLQWNTNIKR
jgi:gliding motility-associated lipoprotein GldD